MRVERNTVIRLGEQIAAAPAILSDMVKGNRPVPSSGNGGPYLLRAAIAAIMLNRTGLGGGSASRLRRSG